MPSPAMNNAINPNIDKLLNPYVPRNQIRHLPTPISHVFGYRTRPAKEPPILVQWTLTVLATVAGICVVGAVYNYAPGVAKFNPPTLVASLGASAVLDYNTIKSPLAQPRNAVVGHTLSAIVGTAIAKAFQNSPAFFVKFDWVAAAIACAASSLAMSVTNTVHPPGGATAILACTETQVIALGWMFPPLMLLASLLMLGVALVFNNTCRQYPIFWWTPEDVGQKLPHRRKQEEEEVAAAKEVEKKTNDVERGADSERTVSNSEVEFVEGLEEVQILPHRICAPKGVEVSEKEVEVLRALQGRVREMGVV